MFSERVFSTESKITTAKTSGKDVLYFSFVKYSTFFACMAAKWSTGSLLQ